MIPIIRLRNRNLELVQQVEDFDEFVINLKYNGNNTWELKNWAPPDFDRASIGGIVLTLDGQVAHNGPIWAAKERWTPKSTTYDLGGSSDDSWFDSRLCLPVVTGPPYTAQAYDGKTGTCEALMHAWTNANAGPSAKPERRVFGLTMGANGGRGPVVSWGPRFELLSEVLLGLSLTSLYRTGVELGWRIVQVGTALQFQTFVPVDKTGPVRFSAELGNLDEFNYDEYAPKVNYAIVAGGGEGTARVFVEGGDSVSMTKWGRYEKFVDQRQTSVTAELQQKQDETLQEGAGSSRLAISPIDTEQMQFMRDYQLGDKVTAIVGGVPIVDVIREVQLNIKPDGTVRATPKIGTPDKRGPVDLFRQMAEVRKRIRNLERR